MTANEQEVVGTGQRSLLKGIRAALTWAPLLSVFSAMPASPPPSSAPLPLVGDRFPTGMTAEARQSLERDLKSLGAKLTSLRSSSTSDLTQLDRLADAGLFHKGIVWALRYETNLATNDIASLQRAMARGHQRVDLLLANQQPWATRKGKILRGYVSTVDGSTQPYGVI